MKYSTKIFVKILKLVFWMNNKNYFEDIRSVTLIMTTDCTLRCKYCFTQDYGFKAEYAD
jgi:DNA repair photolyase